MLSLTLDHVEKWQTLIAGILAVIFAGLTIRRMGRQIDIQKQDMENTETRFNQQLSLQRLEIEAAEKRFNDQTQRRSWAYRAKLLDVMDNMSLYADMCVLFLCGRVSLSEIPRTNTAELKASIEFLDADSAKAAFEIVALFQLQQARFRSYSSFNANLAEWAVQVRTALELKALVDRMFGYVRNEELTARSGFPSREEMHRAWLLTGATAHMTEAQHLRIKEDIDQLHSSEHREGSFIKTCIPTD